MWPIASDAASRLRLIIGQIRESNQNSGRKPFDCPHPEPIWTQNPVLVNPTAVRVNDLHPNRKLSQSPSVAPPSLASFGVKINPAHIPSAVQIQGLNPSIKGSISIQKPESSRPNSAASPPVHAINDKKEKTCCQQSQFAHNSIVIVNESINIPLPPSSQELSTSSLANGDISKCQSWHELKNEFEDKFLL